VGDAGTSRTMGRGVAESHEESRDVICGSVRSVGSATEQTERTEQQSTPFHRSWIVYLKDHSPYLDSSLSL
jgi:hypothetical protein